MLLGFASLVLGIAAASVTRTIAAARAAGSAAGRAFSSGFGRVRAGMASATAWIRGRFAAMGASVGLFHRRMRALSPTMTSFTRGLAIHAASFFRLTRTVSTVTGAYRAANGMWYNSNGTLVLQRNHLRQTTTAWGRFVGGIQNGLGAFSGLNSRLSMMVAGIMALGPAIGVALGAVVTAGLGLAVMGAGIAIAAKMSKRVQEAFKQTFTPIGKEIAETAVTAFEGPLLDVAVRFKQSWSTLGPAVKQALVQTSAYVKPFADGIADMLEAAFAGGGFNKLLVTAGPVINALSDGLRLMGEALNDFFDSLGDSGPGMVKTLTLVLAGLAGIIRGLGAAIEYTSKHFNAMTIFAEEFSKTMAAMLGWLPGVGDAWEYLADKIGGFNSTAGKTTSIEPILGAAVASTTGGFYANATAAEKARKAISDLSDKISGLINSQLGADQAALAFQRALDAVTESVKENGKSIDITKKAGQANIDVVLQAVAAAQAKKEADIKLAGGEKASEAAIRAANAAFQAQIAQLEATLRKAGLTQQQIDQLLGKYKELARTPDITKTITTNVRTVFTTEGRPTKISAPGFHEAYASGTAAAKAGLALVGEEGPELVRLKGGERIWPADETARILAQSKSLAAASSQELGNVRSADSGPGAGYAAPQVGVKVFIGNEEFKGYVAQVTDERADSRAATMARRLNGR